MTTPSDEQTLRPSPAAQARLARARTFVQALPTDLLPDAAAWRGWNEAWFSDTLAWLLDPCGGHGLGVQFLQAFLRRIAQIFLDDRFWARLYCLI